MKFHQTSAIHGSVNTIPETNSEFTPENQELEDEISFWGWPTFQGRPVSFREGIPFRPTGIHDGIEEF